VIDESPAQTRARLALKLAQRLANTLAQFHTVAGVLTDEDADEHEDVLRAIEEIAAAHFAGGLDFDLAFAERFGQDSRPFGSHCVLGCVVERSERMCISGHRLREVCIELSECRQCTTGVREIRQLTRTNFRLRGHRPEDSLKRRGFCPFPAWHKTCSMDDCCDSPPNTSIGDCHRGRDARGGSCSAAGERTGPSRVLGASS
jgi:hypothetical protein